MTTKQPNLTFDKVYYRLIFVGRDMNIGKIKKRVILIDEIRGICIILMLVYHFSFDINLSILDNPILIILRNIVAGIFILISGISCNFSGSNFKRGLRCLFIAILITIITYFILPTDFIIFGILHMLGISMITYAFLKNLLNKINSYFLMSILLLLFIITWNISNGYIGIMPFSISYDLKILKMLIPFGFINSSFSSVDYFPLFPWVFIFLFGTTLGSIRDINNFPAFMYMQRSKVLSFCGKNTLIIYMIHQPIFYCVFLIVEKII